MNFIFSKNQVYDDKYFLYQYNDENIRIVHQKYCRKKGFEEVKKDSYIPQQNKQEIDRISLSRTRRNIRELALYIVKDVEKVVEKIKNGDIATSSDINIKTEML